MGHVHNHKAVQGCLQKCRQAGVPSVVMMTVRDPYSYWQSLYKYSWHASGPSHVAHLVASTTLQASTLHSLAERHAGVLSSFLSFLRWAEGHANALGFTQTRRVQTACGTPCNYDVLLRTENLSSGWSQLVERYQLPHVALPILNVATPSTPATAPPDYALTRETAQIIERLEGSFLFDHFRYARMYARQGLDEPHGAVSAEPDAQPESGNETTDAANEPPEVDGDRRPGEENDEADTGWPAQSQLSFIHIGKCGGTSVGSWLRKHTQNRSYREYHMNRDYKNRESSNFVVWVRDPISRFRSAYDWEVSVVKAPAAKHCKLGPQCPAPQKEAVKLRTGHAYPEAFEAKLRSFKSSNHLAESLYEASAIGAIARELMSDPIEHLHRGIGWYLYDGEFVRRWHKQMFVGTVENMDEDMARLSQVLHRQVTPGDVLHVRTSTHNDTLSDLGRHNLRRWYNATDYAALRELVRFGLLDPSLYDLSFPAPEESSEASSGEEHGRAAWCGSKASALSKMGEFCALPTITSCSTKPRFGGSRSFLRQMVISEPIPVRHNFVQGSAGSRAKEALSLWMYWAPLPAASNATLWYIPNRTIIVSDHSDLVKLLASGTYLDNTSFPTNRSIWWAIKQQLRDVDTVMFAQHLPLGHLDSMDKCVYPNHHPNRIQPWKPLRFEVLALRDWELFSCPGHPMLRIGNPPMQCRCEKALISVEQQKRYELTMKWENVSQEWWDAHKYVCA